MSTYVPIKLRKNTVLIRVKLFLLFKLRYFKRRFTRSGEFRFDISLKRRLNERRFNTSARLTSAASVNTTLKL